MNSTLPFLELIRYYNRKFKEADMKASLAVAGQTRAKYKALANLYASTIHYLNTKNDNAESNG